MISFLPLCSHPNPSSVLIVGGGDGGVAREVSKHPSVRNIVQVEIDERVVEVSKKYLPTMSRGFDSPKVALHIGDGFDFIRRHANDFDVVITDSSDPIGPAECLFSESYFRAIAHALKPGGIVCSQAGTPWIDLGHVRNTVENCRKHFGTVRYAVANVPTYPCGQIGFMVGAVGPDVRLDVPVRVFAREERTEMGLRYYDGVVHTAAFVLPGFVREKLG